jgi:hypothetical protein
MLFSKYCHRNQFKEDEMGGIHRMHGRDEKYKVVFGNFQEKRPLGKPRGNYSYKACMKIDTK